MSEKLIVQILGQPGSGKTEVSKYVAAYGFEPVRVSGIIEEYARPRGLQLRDRADYGHAHVQMLNELGIDIVPQRVLGHPDHRITVDGLRVPMHVESLQSVGGIAIALWCPRIVRFDRVLARKNALDNLEYANFITEEELEFEHLDPTSNRNVHTVMQMADYHIDSSKPLPEVCADVGRIVESRFSIRPIK